MKKLLASLKKKLKKNSGRAMVVRYGGSLIFKNGEIDTELLKTYIEIFNDIVKDTVNLVVVPGGGYVAKLYQDAVKKFGLSDDDMDSLGISAIRVNAELFYRVFGGETSGIEIKQVNEILNGGESSGPSKITISYSTGVGHSSNADAAKIAVALGADTIINLSDEDYIYDSDPDKNPDAKPLSKMSWGEYIKIIPSEWKPKMKVPFDPIASRIAQKNSKKVVFLNGAKPSEFRKFLNGEEFVGTTIFD